MISTHHLFVVEMLKKRAESRSEEDLQVAEAFEKVATQNKQLRTAMRTALKHLDNEKWNHIGAVLLRALGDLPPITGED